MTGPNYYSYRDADARVVKKKDGWYRYIFNTYKNEYEHLMQSGLHQELVENDLLISHEEVGVDTDDPNVHKLIRPGQVQFQSYPFEWSYTQWRKSILAFLDINLTALKHGMLLKDGTPFNFYLINGKSRLLDTSSFMFFKKNDFWLAYRQFCEEFLSPFALMHFNGPQWAKITQTYLRGLPLDFVSKQLSWRTWLNPTCFFHIHLHSRYGNDDESLTREKPKKGFDTEKLSSLLTMIRSTVLSWDKPYRFKDWWTNYYENDIESADYLIDKEKVLTEWLSYTHPKTVIDLGANTGKFSLLAAKHADYVIALEKDENCVDIIESEIEKGPLGNITALTGDLAATSPDLGVLNREYASIYTRGRSEMVIGLALINHLCIAANISTNQVAELFSQFTTKFALVEFIPKEDKKVTQLLKNRKDVFSDYNEANFISIFSIYFDLLKVETLSGSKRKLFLWKKK